MVAMKLLSPTEAVTQSKNRSEGEKQRIVKIQTLIAQKLRELSDAEKAFDTALKEQHDIWAKEETLFLRKKQELEADVQRLEERRIAALIPLENKARELDTKESSLVKLKTELEIKDSDLEETKRLLETRLDEVSERELKANDMSLLLERQKSDLEERAETVNKDSESLTKAFAESLSELNLKKREIELSQAKLDGTRAHFEERERKVEEAEAGYKDRERAIQDKTETLQRAVEEMKLKYNI